MINDQYPYHMLQKLVNTRNTGCYLKKRNTQGPWFLPLPQAFAWLPLAVWVEEAVWLVCLCSSRKGSSSFNSKAHCLLLQCQHHPTSLDSTVFLLQKSSERSKTLGSQVSCSKISQLRTGLMKLLQTQPAAGLAGFRSLAFALWSLIMFDEKQTCSEHSSTNAYFTPLNPTTAWNQGFQGSNIAGGLPFQRGSEEKPRLSLRIPCQYRGVAMFLRTLSPSSFSHSNHIKSPMSGPSENVSKYGLQMYCGPSKPCWVKKCQNHTRRAFCKSLSDIVAWPKKWLRHSAQWAMNLVDSEKV